MEKNKVNLGQNNGGIRPTVREAVYAFCSDMCALSLNAQKKFDKFLFYHAIL